MPPTTIQANTPTGTWYCSDHVSIQLIGRVQLAREGVVKARWVALAIHDAFDCPGTQARSEIQILDQTSHHLSTTLPLGGTKAARCSHHCKTTAILML